MMAAARARIHEIARELPAENRFGGPPPRFEEETQGRIEAHDYAAAHSYSDQQHQPQQRDAYEALPSLGHDSDSHDYPQAHDPHTEMRPAYDGALQRHEEAAYRPEPRNEYHSDRPVPEDDSSGKYERGSSRGSRNAPDPYSAPSSFSSNSANSYDPAAYEANYPKAPRQEPSYMGRGPSEDRGRSASEDRGRDGRDGQSYRSSAPKSDEYNRRDGGDRGDDRNHSYRREAPRQEQRNNSYRRDDRGDDRRSSYQPPQHGGHDAPRPPRDETRAEGTGNRRDGYDDPIPGAPRVPEGFVVGVQPIRGTPSMSPQAVIAPIPAITPSRGQPQPYVVPQSTMGATPNAMMMPNPNSYGGQSFGQMGMPIMQPMMQPMMPPMVPVGNTMMGGVRPHTSMRPGGHVAQPTEVEEARQSSKIGRFAWFVFGAAFGIFFAFFATGFGFGNKEETPTTSFPPPAHIPAPVQVGQAPTPPLLAPAVTPTMVQLAPAAPPVAPPGAFAPTPPGAVAPIAQPQPGNGGLIASPQPFAPVAPLAQPQPAPVRPPPQAQNQGTVRVRPAAPPPPSNPRPKGGGSAAGGEDILGAALGN